MSKERLHSASGPTQRQLRVGELIRRALSDALIQGDIHDPELNKLSITIGEVRCSSDLKIATCFVMPLGGGILGGNVEKAAIEALKRNKGELRRKLGKSTDLKFTPDLRFLVDPTYDQIDETRRLLSDEQVQRDLED